MVVAAEGVWMNAGDKVGDSTGDGAGPVFRRHVLYVPGYDPFPPRRYRELYRKEGAAQAAISGYDLAMAPRSGETYGWRVSARMERPAEAEVEILVWSDLVKSSMERGVLGTYWLLLRSIWVFGGSGTLKQLLRLRKGPMIASLYPAVLLVAQALVAALVGWLMARLVPLDWVGAGLGLVAGYAVLEGFRRMDRRLFVYYLMQDYAFTGVEWGAYPAALLDRLAVFRGRVREALDSGVDEVLVVGHSSGVHLAVSVLADLIREGVPEGPALAFLSLGQAVPMMSFLPRAEKLRGDLQYLSERAELTWVDVSAPGDGCSFALCDPVAVSGVATAAKRWPLVISAAFSQTLSPERWQELRRRYFRLHFQYLCAFDRPGDYDYFRITAGPLTLAERFAGRKPSSSRIERVFSPYDSTA
jgi:hypothetical protein